MKKETIAFFDLDGTITFKDTFIDFIIFVRGKGTFYKGLFYLSPLIFLFFIRIYPNYKLKEKFFKKFLASLNYKDLTEAGANYSQNRLPNIIYNDALERIKWHQNKNHRIVILTASSSIWLSKWCEKYNLELIATNFEIENEKYTGQILGLNCYGAEKLRIVNMILSQNYYEETFGYGNTKSDLYFINQLKNKYYRYFKK